MTHTNLRFLELTPQEALIVESSLKDGDYAEWRWLLLQVGASLQDQKPASIGVNLSDLWYLRDRIKPQTQVGKTTGLDVLLKIYGLLLQANKDTILGMLGVPERPVVISTAREVVINAGSRNGNDGTVENTGEST